MDEDRVIPEGSVGLIITDTTDDGLNLALVFPKKDDAKAEVPLSVIVGVWALRQIAGSAWEDEDE